eukprot:4491688-Amphidinium_carterae.1
MVVKTTPDLAWSYSQVASQQTRNPHLAWAKLRHLCQYISGTMDLGLVIESRSQGERDLEIYAD